MSTPAQPTLDQLRVVLKAKSPIADVAFRLIAYGFTDDVLLPLWDKHRGRHGDVNVTFRDMLDWILDALTRHGGSGNSVFEQDQKAGRQRQGARSTYYRKLAGQPPAVSRALLREVTPRLRQLWPEDAPPMNAVPACFDAFTPVIFDGKKVKQAPKRTKALRGFKGSLLAAKALVATEVRTGLAIAMSSSLDGETNDVPLVPELIEQVTQLIEDTVLYLADRQFGNKLVIDELTRRDGDAYAVRIGKALTFTADADHPQNQSESVEGSDDEGRAYRDEIGVICKGKASVRVRRIHLDRGGGDDVIVVTNLMDADAYPAADLLTLYRRRWGIENVFQDVTETFGLKQLIGNAPEAALFQLSLCLSIYNMHQVIRSHLAVAGREAEQVTTIREVSCKRVHREMSDGMTAWLLLVGLPDLASDTLAALRADLVLMGARGWHKGLVSAMDRPGYVRKKSAEFRVHGGHTSVKRLTDLTDAQRAKARKTGKVRRADLKPS